LYFCTKDYGKDPSQMKKIPAEKILCICPIGIGNYLLMYPAVARLRQLLPQAKIHLLALRHGINEFATKDGLWDQVHCFDPTKIGFSEKIDWIRKLRAEGFDSSLAFFPSNKREYALLPLLCGISQRFGFSYSRAYYKQLNFLQNQRIAADIHLHDIEQNLRLVDYFTSPVSAASAADLQWPVLWDAAEETQAKDWLQRQLQGELQRELQSEFTEDSSNFPSYIAVHPGSSIEHGMDAKRWEAEKFGELLAKAQKFLTVQKSTGDEESKIPEPAILIFGGPGEEALKDEVQKYAVGAGAQRVVQVPVMKLGATACLLAGSLFCLCNDSGLMHIASAGGAPVAALFGPTDEKRNGPLRKPFVILRKAMDGYPCWTAATAGDRESGQLDPARPLREFSVDEAWSQLSVWLDDIRMKQ